MLPTELSPETRTVYDTLRTSILAAQDEGVPIMTASLGVTRKGTHWARYASCGCCAVGAYLLGRAVIEPEDGFNSFAEVALQLEVTQTEVVEITQGFDFGWGLTAFQCVGALLRREFIEKEPLAAL